jgi:aspartate-semialdehyde dehydrogenase
MTKIPVGILGATGTVGQRFVQLLATHPWFEVTALAASDRSAGQTYGDACHWLLPTAMPEAVARIVVQHIEPGLDCTIVFSALPSGVAGPLEDQFAQAGYVVCSNAAAHRLDPDVPLLIPEVNAAHTAMLNSQRRQRGWPGLVVTSANCSTTQLALALKPLQDAFGIRKVSVVSLQAVSGGGYPGVPSLEVLGNVIPYISGEEAKVERESRKLLGRLEGQELVEAPFVVSAQCNRVPVRDGHMECVSLEFEAKQETRDVIAALEAFHAPPDVQSLPSSPGQPIVVRREADRPQPIRDANTNNGMSVVVGRVRTCPVLHQKFVLLGHNTLRGAAGGSIHSAELLVMQGWCQ